MIYMVMFLHVCRANTCSSCSLYDVHVSGNVPAANVLLSEHGNVKLADFGCSFFLNKTPSKRQGLFGTPSWMAPEIIEDTGCDTKVCCFCCCHHLHHCLCSVSL